jgi:hypothetical protein
MKENEEERIGGMIMGPKNKRDGKVRRVRGRKGIKIR